MSRKTNYFILSLALCSVPFFNISAKADTVVTKTTTQQQTPVAGGRMVNLNDFDLNRDKLLSRFEVGEMIFKLYDANSNYLLDADEYERKVILTVVPVEKSTTVVYDYNSDGIADKTQYSNETFMQDTLLSRFDKDKDGMTPHEFINKDFAAVDTDANKGIDLIEWRDAYISGTPVPTGM